MDEKKKKKMFSHDKPLIKSLTPWRFQMVSLFGNLTKREGKMAGYWSICFLLLMDQDGVEAHKLPIKGRGQCPTILTEQA